MKLKKKTIIIGTILILLFLFILCGFLYYKNAMNPKSNSNEEHIFTLNSGTSKLELADILEQQGLIKSGLALKLYLFFHSNLNLQAGTYVLTESMTPEQMLQKMHKGDIKNDSIRLTLYEGKRLTEYAESIAKSFAFTKEEVLEKLNDPTYLQELTSKYWFLTEEILDENIYYPLEGYLFPDTYEFKEHSSLEEIIETILNNTNAKLEDIKEEILASSYSIHEILAMASIIELEAVEESDRETVSQVIYKRLETGKCLGMDVTTYYAVKKEMGVGLTLTDLKTASPYNTSEMNGTMLGKLPIGPICNPSKISIQSVLHPSDTDYLYFYADVKTKKVYFSKTYEEHVNIQKQIG